VIGALTLLYVGKEVSAANCPVRPRHSTLVLRHPNKKEGSFAMSTTQQLSTLSDRAKKAEDNVNAAKAKNKADLKTQADAARKSSQEKAAELTKKADAAQGEASGQVERHEDAVGGPCR
jgi:hypothetical protein